MSESPLPAMAWAVVGALGGLLGLWALIIAFFLLYSPFYLIGKLPLLVGKGGWVDRREVRFYLACFGLLCVLAALTYCGAPRGTHGLRRRRGLRARILAGARLVDRSASAAPAASGG